ncbi:unnamed protein product [Ectocarpus fasciculatus]
MDFPGAAEDPEQRSFIDPVWLQQWGLGPQNALDYFALSPFYDKACNNEQCRMQGVKLPEGLLNLTGLEFMLVELPPEMSFLPPGQPAPPGPQPRRLFVIKKQVRKSPSSVEVQAIYYIMEGVIYQAPTVQKLIKSRLNKFTHHLNNAFVELSKLAKLRDSGGGYDWAWQKEAKDLQEKAEAAEGVGVAEEDRDAKAALKLSMDNILMGLVEKYIDGDGDGEGKEGKEPAARGAKRKADGEAVTSASLDAASAAATSTMATSTMATSTMATSTTATGATATSAIATNAIATSTAATSTATPTTSGMTKTLAATEPTR